MKLLYILVPTLGLAACASQHSEPLQSSSSEQIDDTALPDADSPRKPSRVHTYIVNDYVDPNNPRLRHRGHLVDVVEQDEKWNLAPTDPTESNLGPVTTSADSNAAPNPYSAEFETELAQQRNQYQQLADLGAKMTAEMSRLQDMAEKSADAISENATLRHRLNTLQQEIDALKPASPPLAPDAPKRPSWLDTLFDLFRQTPQGTPIAKNAPEFRTNALLRPTTTNAPASDAPTASEPTPTNAPDEPDIVPAPGEMSRTKPFRLSNRDAPMKNSIELQLRALRPPRVLMRAIDDTPILIDLWAIHHQDLSSRCWPILVKCSREVVEPALKIDTGTVFTVQGRFDQNQNPVTQTHYSFIWGEKIFDLVPSLKRHSAPVTPNLPNFPEVEPNTNPQPNLNHA